MRRPLAFRLAAQAELDSATIWYEGQKPGLGEAFLTEVQQVLDILANHLERYPIADGDVREAPVSRFPYCIYYRVKPTRVVVIAVFHSARDPSIWQERK